MQAHQALLVLAPLALGLNAAAQDIQIADANTNFTKNFHGANNDIFPTGAAVDFLQADAAGDAAGALFTSSWIFDG